MSTIDADDAGKLTTDVYDCAHNHTQTHLECFRIHISNNNSYNSSHDLRKYSPFPLGLNVPRSTRIARGVLSQGPKSEMLQKRKISSQASSGTQGDGDMASGFFDGFFDDLQGFPWCFPYDGLFVI